MIKVRISQRAASRLLLQAEFNGRESRSEPRDHLCGRWPTICHNFCVLIQEAQELGSTGEPSRLNYLWRAHLKG
jgi:hypothetical protein